ncbi:FAD binding domain-containing protein [Dunaliella salina]|uniref:FAD binding domain-containing protein n=1 Tax=Dunaliella salina TaxID=3046 RepID=A0ABQ7GYV4_DUNSA|nr:FAD binding domain-containing protein [Dunaliella salina]|eukprot:KAF5839785.1 FAD binding domain-containing protein [Dunaliella salina]
MAAMTAHEARQASGAQLDIVLVDKMKIGGNSAKASSGMNALTPPSGDTPQLFMDDTLKSGGGRSKQELVQTLVENSEAAIASLAAIGVDLTKVSRLGGHSVARSHSNPGGGNVGWQIMSKLGKKVRDLSELKQQPISIRENTALVDIVMSDGKVTGVRLSPANKPEQTETLPCQAVVLATGGYSASKELLKVHNPTAATLPTTNGPWATGDNLDIAERAGARLIDLSEVQIHPTGFIDPNDPDSNVKFLAPEKLRGLGAILLNSSGKRFVDEMTTRDRVSDAIMGQPGRSAWLLIPQAAASEFGMEAIDFYCRRNLMVHVEDVSLLAALLNTDQQTLIEELELYNEVVQGHEKDPFGKSSFPPDIFFGGSMYAAEVTPVVHYTMGGIEIDSTGRALAAAPGVGALGGLYAAGEASGGVHGVNRLGGNSLLECAVFGSITGKAAVTYAVNSLSN